MGTTLLKSIKGWRAFIRLIYFFRCILGVIPLISREYFALAKIKSKLPFKIPNIGEIKSVVLIELVSLIGSNSNVLSSSNKVSFNFLSKYSFC